MPESKPAQSFSGAPAPESLFSRLVVAPVLFVTFLLSLAVIDRQTYGTVFSRNPHQGHHDHSRSDSPDSHGSDYEDHYHYNKRKLARQEFEEAFQLRSKILAGFVMIGGVSAAVLGWLGSKTWGIMVKG